MIEIGVNIVEIVTKGLYTDSRDIFREYIQNSCDAIDDAIEAGILSEGEGLITIRLDSDTRKITIEDNGAGINTRDFVRTMSKIGSSDKRLETDRGFRGIGRLCGLAYCREARFSSKVKGETKSSTMTVDAERLRKEFFSDHKQSAEFVLREVMRFDKTDATAEEHFFRVELIDIVDTNSVLLDKKAVREYLSFVAPVTYSSNFYYQTEIYKHAKTLGFNITEYRINVDGEPVVKNYKTTFNTTHNGKDEIFGVDFREFHDEAGTLIAWSWIGLSNFKGVLDQKSGTADNMMRGIRLRTGNIQIGDTDVFKNLFSEARGTNYFIGEVHTVDTNLIPNSRRDYFEENKVRNVLESRLKEYFEELASIYRTASDVRIAYKAVAAPDELERDFNKKSAAYQKSHRAEHEIKLAAKKDVAEKNLKIIERKRREAEQNPNTPWSRVILRMTDVEPIQSNAFVAQPYDTEQPDSVFPPSIWRKDLRKLYNAIEAVILDNPKLAGVELVNKIKTELTK